MPAAQEAYLFDRIAMYEGRSQRYGTQSLLCPDGKYRRWQTENPEALNLFFRGDGTREGDLVPFLGGFDRSVEG